MAFFLEERTGSYLQSRSGADQLGPGAYDVPSQFGSKQNFKRKNVPAFNQSTNKQSIFATAPNYHPAPGQYTGTATTFKANYIAKQLAKESGEVGVFYMVENGNLQKKVQPYAADVVPRFHEMTQPMRTAATVNLGPGAYNVTKALPPAMPVVLQHNETEAPLKQTKIKLKETA